MSFYTTLSFYRAGPPPELTGADLAAFVSMFASLGLSDEGGTINYQVKFGRSIDQDEEPTWSGVPVTTGGTISEWRPPGFDAEGSDFGSLAGLSGGLAGLRGTIYRADLALGNVGDALFDRLKREPSEDNEVGLALRNWGLEVGPILSYSLGSEGEYLVGWIAVNLHGYGYLHPWTFRDLIDRAEAVAPILDLMRGCRRLWPIAREKPPRRVVKARKGMGELWPYPRADEPWDWSWGLGEAG